MSAAVRIFQADMWFPDGVYARITHPYHSWELPVRGVPRNINNERYGIPNS